MRTLVPELESVRVEKDDQVEALRVLRNATSLGFAFFNGQISSTDQQKWWQSMQGYIEAWLYWHKYDEIWAGFGMVRLENGKWWNSIGVDPVYQGRGYGSFITADILDKHLGTVYAAVRRENASAARMHHTDDWEEITGQDNRRLMYFRSKQ
jgi:GNAT superfamily N-acetyltransferase